MAQSNLAGQKRECLFAYEVDGEELAFSLRKERSGAGALTAALENLGRTFTPEQVAEELVRMVVGES